MAKEKLPKNRIAQWLGKLSHRFILSLPAPLDLVVSTLRFFDVVWLCGDFCAANIESGVTSTVSVGLTAACLMPLELFEVFAIYLE